VSKTRLSVRNLPKEVDDATLRRVFTDAVDELKEKGISTKMVQVKVARDPNREHRSRGYGFVEFEAHAAALEALKKINNSDKVLPNGHRLIVEFAIENSLVMQKRTFRQQKAKDGGKKGDAPAGTTEEGGEDATPAGAATTPKKPGKPQNPKKRERPESNKGDKAAAAAGGAGKDTASSKPAPKRLKTNEGFQGKPQGKKDGKKEPSVSLNGQSRKQRSQQGKRQKESENRLERLIDDYKKKFD
jgi:RNA recognition motif-containing protein